MPRAKKTTKQERLIERDLTKIILFGVGLVVLYLIASYYFKSFNHFEYEGLSFTRERFDQNTVYHYYYYYKDKSGQLVQYNLYLHNDPRYNNVTIEGDPLLLSKRYVYLTYDDSFPVDCRYTGSSTVDFNLFLKQNQLTVFSGVTNQTDADITNRTHITCETQPSAAEVFEFRGGDTTKIVVEGNCHKVYIGPDCLIREATEKLKVAIVSEARKRASVN